MKRPLLTRPMSILIVMLSWLVVAGLSFASLKDTYHVKGRILRLVYRVLIIMMISSLVSVFCQNNTTVERFPTPWDHNTSRCTLVIAWSAKWVMGRATWGNILSRQFSEQGESAHSILADANCARF